MQSSPASTASRLGSPAARTRGSSASARGVNQGSTLRQAFQNGVVSTIRSRTTGSPASGSSRSPSRAAVTGVRQARAGRPSTRIAHVPHIATRQE